MSIPLIINGVTYDYPETGDVDWGPDATDWASAVTAGMLQKAGGLFQLLAEVDFGTTYGLKSNYYKSRTANVASAGVVRLARADLISWRNQANNADLSLSVDSSDNLFYNGAPIGGFTVADTTTIDMSYSASILSADIVPNSITDSEISGSAGIIYSKLNLSNGIVNDDINTTAAIAYSKLNLTAEIVDNDISAGAAISYNKLNLTNGIVSADIASPISLAKGGTNKNMTAVAGGIVYTDADSMEVTAAGAVGQYLLSDGSSTPVWRNDLATAYAVSSQTVTLLDKCISANCTGGSLTITLYTAFGNAGRTVTINREDASANSISIVGQIGETINGWSSLDLFAQYDSVTLISDGVNWVIINAVRNPVVNTFLSGSGTYTTPKGARYLTVELVGGGGGGGGASGNGGTGGNSTFGTSLLTAGGGAGGQAASGGAGNGGVGGTATVNSPAVALASLSGGDGGGSTGASNGVGGQGGVSYFGGAAPVSSIAAGVNGLSGKPNTGSGAAGLNSTGSAGPGRGGGAGAYIKAMIPSPSNSYAYSVGAGGAFGTGGNTGGLGGSGVVIVTAYFQ